MSNVITSRYAIFKTGGKQYQAIEGKTIAIEKITGEPGNTVEFKEVLLRKLAADAIEIGRPFVATPIKASIVKHMRGEKLVVYKFKRRKKYKRKLGHRQPITVVRIETI